MRALTTGARFFGLRPQNDRGRGPDDTGAAMYINTKGIILRETKYKESSKMLTVLTGSEGKISASARGAVRKNSRLASSTQLLAFSDMTLFCNNDRWSLTEAQPIELFHGLCEDIELFSLGAYFAEVTEAAADTDSHSSELLSLLLNSLYVLSEHKKEPGLVKLAFEMRLMCLSGFAPLVDACPVCGKKEPESPILDIAGGTALCRGCAGGAADCLALCEGSLNAIRHLVFCEDKKIFSFTLGEEPQRLLSLVAEAYLLRQLDRRFKTLDYYKTYRVWV